MNLNGKVALVTGGASGIGLATVKKFLACGAKVLIADLAKNGEEVAKSLGNDDTVLFCRTNVTVESEVEAAVKKAVEHFGKLDITIADAGVSGFTLDMWDTDVWNKTLAVNLNGAFFTCKYAAKQMKAQGTGGAIVCLGSFTTLVGNYGTVCYPASKSAIAGLVRSMAVTCIQDGIRVNAICPGSVETALVAEVPADEIAETVKKHPIGRLIKPEEIANVITFMVSDEASAVVGSIWAADGGYTAI